MTDASQRRSRRPRTTDYVMWGLIALTMIVVCRAAFSIDNPIVRAIAVVYVALGAFLCWRRWRALR